MMDFAGFFKPCGLALSQRSCDLNQKSSMADFWFLHSISCLYHLLVVVICHFSRVAGEKTCPVLIFFLPLNSMRRIRIAIVDSQAERGKQLGDVLACQKDFNVIGFGSDSFEAVRITDAHKPDIVLLDTILPYADGWTTASLIKSRSPATAIIIFCDRDDDFRIFEYFSRGVSGYVTQKTSPAFLSQSIRTLCYGGTFISPEITDKAGRIFSEFIREYLPSYAAKRFDIQAETEKAGAGAFLPSPKNISLTELRIMQYLGHGLSTRKIAEKLNLKEGTVRNNISSVLQKTGLKDRTQMAIYSLKLGL